MAESEAKFERILWVDLEMTGLDPVKDKVVEVAAVITDWDFNELAVFESGVRQNRWVLAGRLTANPFWAARKAEAAEIVELSLESPSTQEVEQEIVKIVDTHIGQDKPLLLAGNSIHQDRQFIRRAWPELESRLHYRMLDVSAWKVVMQGKYHRQFEKNKAHRALDDIRESIAELKFYLKNVN